MCAVQYDKAEPSKREQEAGCEPFHDVLSVNTIRHERYRSNVPMFISRGSYARRLHYHVIYNPCNTKNHLKSDRIEKYVQEDGNAESSPLTSGNQKIRQQHQRESCHRWWRLQPCWFLNFYMRNFKHCER